MREIKKISNMYVDKPFQMTEDSLERFKSATSLSDLKSTHQNDLPETSPLFGGQQSLKHYVQNEANLRTQEGLDPFVYP
jgi:hypothetical protein